MLLLPLVTTRRPRGPISSRRRSGVALVASGETLPPREEGVTVPIDAGDCGVLGGARLCRGIGGRGNARRASCTDLKVAQARAVLGATATLAEKANPRERVCSVKYGGSVGVTVRSERSTDFDWVVAGLKEEPAYVKQLKKVSLGDQGYSYDRYAVVNGKPTLTLRVLFFRAGARMYQVEVAARRSLPAAKHMTLARNVLRNARGG